MKAKISILGCGWLGESLATYLLKHGFSVQGSSTSKSKSARLSSLGIIPFVFSIDSLDEHVLPFFNAEILIIDIPSKNISGFKNLISLIEKSPVQKIIFVSSTSVYENTNSLVTEDTAVNSSALAEIEKLFYLHSGFTTTIVRFAGLFGYDRKPGNFFPQGMKISNPEGALNMIHRDDCIQIIYEIISQECWGELFNACADSHPSRREFYTQAALAVGKEIPEFDSGETSDYKIVSNQKLKTKLHYVFKYSDILCFKEN